MKTCALLGACALLLARPGGAAEPGRVAVMPFQPLAQASHAWIGAGIAEALTAALSAVP